jgi:hypothetical protein
MSENLNLARSILADWERGDFSSVEWADANIESERVPALMGGQWTGVSGMAEGFRDFLSAWEDFRIAEVEEYREIDDERVLVLHRFTGRGKTSGLEVEHTQPKGASLFRIEKGKVVRLVYYGDGNRALADLGLKE